MLHISQGASCVDGTPVLPRLTRFAPQIRTLVTSRNPIGDLSALGAFSALEELTLQHPGEAIPFERLDRCDA